MTSKSRKPVAKTKGELSTESKKLAAVILRPSVNAAFVVSEYAKRVVGELELSALIGSLADSMTEINGGKLDRVENMLFGQANALQSIFVNLSQRAASQDYLKQLDTYLRIALKAQSQCRATLETLVAIKNPPVVFARQANIANGHQQINNGAATPARAEEIESAPNKLSGAKHELLPDTRTSSLTLPSNQDVEALGAIHRAKVAARKR